MELYLRRLVLVGVETNSKGASDSEVNEDDDDDDDDTDAVCYLLTMMTCQSLSVTI